MGNCDYREENLSQPRIDRVRDKYLLDSIVDGREMDLSVRVWALQKVGIVFRGTTASRWAMTGRGERHLVLSTVQWQEVVEPAYLEESVGKAGFGVGDGIEKCPIDRMEL
jgi:hypothetical protein